MTGVGRLWAFEELARLTSAADTAEGGNRMAIAAWQAAVQWGPGEPPWGWHMWWGAWGIGMLVFMILFWALIILGIIALVRWAFGWSGAGRAVGPGRALEILKERYARGEISREQFEAMRRDLDA